MTDTFTKCNLYFIFVNLVELFDLDRLHAYL